MNRNPRWIQVTQSENIPMREGRAVEIEGHELAVFNLGDRFLTVENRCPHRGGPLSDGIVAGDSIVCPLHAWKVCLDDGAVVKPAEQKACVATYSTRVEAGVVCVRLPAQERLAAFAVAQILPSPGGADEQDLVIEATAG